MQACKRQALLCTARLPVEAPIACQEYWSRGSCERRTYHGAAACRLITRGTIEEKVYHRQIYKQALSTRILTDPRQKRFVASRDIRDLFSLSDRQHGDSSETGRIFRGVSTQVTKVDVASSDSSGSEGGDDGAPSPDVGAEGKQHGGKGDSAILKELFDGTGLHSALNHSAIESASDPAKLDIEQHASKVAERAAAALRASRAAVRAEPVHMCAPAVVPPLYLVGADACGAYTRWEKHAGQRGRGARAHPGRLLALDAARSLPVLPLQHAVHAGPADRARRPCSLVALPSLRLPAVPSLRRLSSPGTSSAPVLRRRRRVTTSLAPPLPLICWHASLHSSPNSRIRRQPVTWCSTSLLRKRTSSKARC